MCNQSHFWAANYKDLFQTGQSFLSKCEKFPKETAFFTRLITDLLHFMTFHGLFSTKWHHQQSRQKHPGHQHKYVVEGQRKGISGQFRSNYSYGHQQRMLGIRRYLSKSCCHGGYHFLSHTAIMSQRFAKTGSMLPRPVLQPGVNRSNTNGPAKIG